MTARLCLSGLALGPVKVPSARIVRRLTGARLRGEGGGDGQRGYRQAFHHRVPNRSREEVSGSSERCAGIEGQSTRPPDEWAEVFAPPASTVAWVYARRIARRVARVPRRQVMALPAAPRRLLPRIALLAALLGTIPVACSQPATGVLPLKTVAEIPLSGRATRWDYASLDAAGHRLYLAHMGDGVVTVVDTQKRAVLADITDADDVHGVLFVPELDRVYASATGKNEVIAIDPKTLHIIARIPGGDYPDGMAYAPEAHKLYVSDEHGGTDTVIDVRSHTRVATIALGGEVGNTQYDPVSKHIFANVQTRGQLVEIDPATDKVVRRIDLPGAKGNHGLYIDAASRLAFIACEGNDRLLVLDLESRQVLAGFDVAKDPDVLAFDPSLGRLYVAGESGEVSVFQVKAKAVQALGTAQWGSNAHVVAVDPGSHEVYFPLKSVQGKPRLRIAQPAG